MFSKRDQFCSFWDQFCRFAYLIRLGDHFCGHTPCVLGHKILQDLIQNDGGDSSMDIDGIQLEYRLLVWEHTGHQKQNEKFYDNKLALSSMKII